MAEVKGGVPLSEDEFEAILRRWQKPLIRYVSVQLPYGDDAYDVVTDVFVEAYNKALSLTPPFVHGGDEVWIRRWLFRRATWRTTDRLRRPQYHYLMEPLTEESATFEIDPRHETVTMEEILGNKELLQEGLHRLARREVVCIVLHLQGFAHAEIADHLHETEENIRQIYSRAMRALRSFVRQSVSVPKSSNLPLNKRGNRLP